MRGSGPDASLVTRNKGYAGGAVVGAEGMRQRAKDMADKLRQKSQGGQKSKSRHKTQGRSKLIEEQMKKLQERRHRHR